MSSPLDRVAARSPWLPEVMLGLIGYGLYTLVRNAIQTDEASALRHGRSVQHWQERLGIDFEAPFNRWVAEHEPVAQVMNYFYSTLHFVVTLAVLAWLYLRHSDHFRPARTVLFLTTLVALAGFYFYPLAPPRLLPQYGYVDTVTTFQTWGSLADPNIAERSNQFAAMPSLHMAWALWAGWCVLALARSRWLRALAVVYPPATFVVIIGTANHFVVDAAAGALVLGAGVAVQFALTGRRAFEPANRRLAGPRPEDPSYSLS